MHLPYTETTIIVSPHCRVVEGHGSGRYYDAKAFLMIVTVFRSRLAAGVQDEYGFMARRMSELVRDIPGYVSHKGFTAEDGERVTIVEFESEETLDAWKIHPEHRIAKKLGFTKFFSTFQYQICNVIGGRSWESKAGVE